jgi:hypothetical protein
MRPLLHRVLTAAELAADRREAAEEWTRRAEASAQTLALPFTTAQAELARTMLLLADGDADSACVLALRAARRLRSIGAVVEAGISDMLAGRALALTGRRQDAIGHLQHAYAALAGSGANSYRDEAARDLRRWAAAQRAVGRAAASARHPRVPLASLATGRFGSRPGRAHKISQSHRGLSRRGRSARGDRTLAGRTSQAEPDSSRMQDRSRVHCAQWLQSWRLG